MPDQVDWRAMQGEGTPARAVGRLLRDQREELGLSLSDVGQRLRIRRPYIEAIEEGRFNELPGAAYIPAFLRAYAVHLGLDPEKVLTAYHSSGAVAPIARPTALPTDFPLAERRKPYGLAVLTVLLVVAAGYAVWHFMPRETPVMAQKVPPVPDRLLAERAPSAPAARATTPTQTQAQTPPAEMWPLPKTETATTPSAVTVAPPAATQSTTQPATTPPAATVGQAQAAQPAVPSEPRVEPQARVEVQPRPDTPRVEEPVRAAETPQRVEPPRIDVLRGPTAPLPQEARAVPPREETPRNEVSLPMTRDTPIGVRVDSWVELRAPNGDVLAQTYVRAGESYTIPAGIAFRVINAR